MGYCINHQHSLRFWQIITDETFARHEGFDLASFDEKNWPPSDLPTFRVLKQETYSVFKSRIAHHFNLPEDTFRLWVLVNRQNKTVRPDTPIPENESTLSKGSGFRLGAALTRSAVEVIRNTMSARQTDLRLYLDLISDPTKVC
jgi:Ubiquitin carboxyl-terminal hydrolase